MIQSREKEAYERVERRFRKACLDDASPYSHLVWRYMSKKDLRSLVKGLIGDVRNDEDIAPSALPSIVAVIRELLIDDLLRELGDPTDEDFRVYWLALRGGRANSHDPYELVSSLDREGVISHFSALAFYELTDIRATAHFLTAPKKRPATRKTSRDDRANLSKSQRRQEQDDGSTKPKMGTACFSYDGVAYRLRHSYPEYIFGFSEHWVDDYERVRVSRLEKAVLDAVNDPACNGRMRGVIEAWEKGAERIREQRLKELLHKFDRSSLWRRVGALADHVGRGDLAEMVRSQ